MNATAGPRPASRRSVAIRRPGWTASRGSPSSGPRCAAVASRSATRQEMPHRRAGRSGRRAMRLPGGAWTTSSSTSPIRKKAWRGAPPGVGSSRSRRKASPAARRASAVRSRSGVKATTWSTASTPFGCGTPRAGAALERSVGSPSSCASASARTLQLTIPRPACGPSKRSRSEPSSRVSPLGEKPAAAQTPGASAIRSSSIVGWETGLRERASACREWPARGPLPVAGASPAPSA